MRILSGSFSFVALIIFAGVATAKIDACQPDGMSDVEAARIIAIATQQGKAFRTAIDAIRASGVSYETDTTYDDLMADPERALALALERHEGREKSSYGNSPEKELEIGAGLGRLLKYSINLWVKKQNVNFFTTELTSHLQQLAIQLGGDPTESPYRYKIDASTFVFALGHFTKGAEFKYIRGSVPNRIKNNLDRIRANPSLLKYWAVNYKFSEERGLIETKSRLRFPILHDLIARLKTRSNGRKPNFKILIFLTTNPAGEDITLDGISFNGVDLLKSRHPANEPRDEGCLATFTQTED